MKLMTTKKADPTSILDVWGLFLLMVIALPALNTVFPILNIDISNPLITSLILIATGLILTRIFKSIRLPDNNPKLTLSNALQVLSFVVVLFFLGYSSFSVLKVLTAPMLHDPYDHAIWAKTIMLNNEIDYFYSPLLHAAAATFSFDQINRIPWMISFFTQVSVFLIPINYTLLFYYFTRKTKYSLIFFLLVSSLQFPADLFYSAGKNALILGLSLIPFVVVSLDKAKKTPDRFHITKAALSLFLLFMAHYPSFGVLITLILPWLSISLLENLKQRKWKGILLLSAPFMIGALLCLVWFIPRYAQNVEYLDQSLLTPEKQTPTLNPIALFSLVKFYLYKYLINPFQPWHTILLIPVVIKRVSMSFRLTYLWGFLSFALSYAFVEALALTNLLGMVPNAINIIFPTLLAYAVFSIVVIVLMRIKIEKVLFFLLLMILTTVSVSIHMNLNEKIVSAQKGMSVVSADDLVAYEFIEQELPTNAKILNAAREDTGRKGVIFPTDGGLWIPLYTNKEILIDFRDFSSIGTNQNFELLQRLVLEEDDTEVINKFKEMGYEYAYLDEGIYGSSLSDNVFNNTQYEIIFEQEKVKVIKF